MKRFIGILIVIGLMVFPISVFAGSATLTWTANSEADLAGYKVYRGNGVCAVGPLQPLVVSGSPVSLGKVTTYTDTTVPVFDGDLCYELTAIDTANNESPHSTRATKVINGIPPVAPTGLTITSVVIP